MGRYYANQQGDQGKFWVALQPSDDPETVYDMDECDTDDGTFTNYFGDNSELIKVKLDEQYDILGVPKDERKYELANINDRFDYIWKDLFKYYLRYDNPDDVAGYYIGDNKPSAYPISEKLALAASRVDLGLFIYNTIKEYGECTMEAEF